jgi:hypothetical protein
VRSAPRCRPYVVQRPAGERGRWPGGFFNNEQFNFEFQFALGGVIYGGGDLGEMLSTAERINDGDAESWWREWIATAQRDDVFEPWWKRAAAAAAPVARRGG